MRIKYSILWVDDEIEFYKDSELDKELEKYLLDLSFIPSIDMFENVEDAEAVLERKKYDLIFSDYNINENRTGKDFIENLRTNSVNCEVLFYSAMQDLPKNGFDRVTFFRLDSSSAFQKLLEKMKKVINLTVDKLNDLTNLRGLVISEVCDLDDLMDEILILFCKTNHDKGNDIVNYLVRRKENEVKDSLVNENKCDKKCFFSSKRIDVQEQIRSFDSAYKARGINKIISIIDYKPIHKNFYEDYLDEIINPRNDLAHCVSFLENGRDVLKTRKGPHSFGIDEIKIIRSNIIKYFDYFSLLQEKLNKEE